jgi:hypothetical protein
MFRAFLLAHPDADVAWTLAEDGSTDVLMTDRTQRTFRRWHQAQEEAAMPPPSDGLVDGGEGLDPVGLATGVSLEDRA